LQQVFDGANQTSSRTPHHSVYYNNSGFVSSPVSITIPRQLTEQAADLTKMKRVRTSIYWFLNSFFFPSNESVSQVKTCAKCKVSNCGWNTKSLKTCVS